MSSSATPLSPSTMATRIINPHPTMRRSNPKPFDLCRAISTTTARRRTITCKATLPSSSSIMEFDLYDLLGIDSSSDQPQIKNAYRTLQKRCHPDIAGPVGHDMAIILNEAYAVLSDSASRAAYDKEQAKMAEMRGYTGKPMYSTWFGSETEQRAVFVDEVKCVGCLKCALFASKTFAVESVYGRARVVAQWADPEHVIQEAIDACPVNCISTVERSDLPALEFLMSKQPRGSVRIGVGNTVGARASDVFNEVKLFQRKLDDRNKKASSKHEQSRGQDIQRDRRMSAVQAIRSISNWLYQQPISGSSPVQEGITRVGLRSRAGTEPRLDKLKMAAAARKHATLGLISRTSSLYGDEYWVPLTPILPPGTPDATSASSVSAASSGSKKSYKNRPNKKQDKVQTERKWPLVWGIPAGASAIGAIAVGLRGGAGGGVGGVTEHVGGSLALEIVNSFWLQVMLAGATWYIIGLTIVSTIEVLGRHEPDQNE